VYGLPGPFLVVASFVSVFLKGPPAISIVLFIAGSSSMRIQASMTEICAWKSLRNGALLIIAFMILFLVVLDDYVWPWVGFAVAGGMLLLHRQHEQMLKQRRGPTTLADLAAERFGN